MVALFALSAPAQPAPEAETDVEQVEVQAVEQVLGATVDRETRSIRDG
jgi:hypothetical protein